MSDDADTPASRTPGGQEDNEAGDWGVGVTLSGGGHRSTLVSLGVLLALVDTGWNVWTRSITSVSGGSLASAFVWSRCDFRSILGRDFDEIVREGMRNVQRGAILGTKNARVRLIALACAAGVASGPLAWSLARGGGGSRLPLLLGTIIAVLALLSARGWILELNLAELWFSAPSALRTKFQGHPMRAPGELEVALVDRDQPTLHLVAATDLVSGTPVYVTEGAVIADRMAWPLTSMPLARAVRSSMTVPGLLPPVREHLAHLVHDGRSLSVTRNRTMVLVDGGLFNNLGTDWEITHRSSVRAADYAVLHPSHAIDTAVRVIVDASRDVELGRSRLARVPLLATAHAIVRSVRVVFRSGLYARQLPQLHGWGSTTIGIRGGNLDTRMRWTLPSEMHLTRGAWAYVAERVRCMPTTLRGQSKADAAILVAHVYREAVSELYRVGAHFVDGSAWDRWLASELMSVLPASALDAGGHST